MPLSNSTAQTLATTPYFDDYYTSNTTTGEFNGVEFDFHRILFRPRYGVQSRELTQMQTLLQVQLERLGAAQFRNGDRVIGGQLTLNLKANAGQVLANTTLTNFFDRESNIGKSVFLASPSGSETTRTDILQYVGIDDGETSNNYLIFGQVLSGSFAAGNIIQDRNGNATATFASTGTVFSPASVVSIDEGVCFVSGVFARIRPQTIVLDPFSSTPSYRIGLEIQEQILDENDDVVGESLGDPANQGAPGANRLRVRLQLSKRSINVDSDDNFITLGTVIDGVMQTSAPRAKYITVRELEEILARRTYDESGDYLIRPFSPVIEGATTANSTNSQDITEFALSLSAGKAYVRGFEIETTDATRLPINKARSSASVDNESLAATVGNYTLVTRLMSSAPTNYFANVGTVDLHCVPVASIQAGNATSANATSYNYSRIGTARVRMVEAGTLPEDITPYANAASYLGDSTYKLFFFDTQFDELTGTIVTASYNASTTKTTLVIDAPGQANNDKTGGANGVPRVNGALEGVSISLGGTSSGIYTIESYVTANSADGSTGNVSLTLKEFVSSVPANTTSYRLLFQPRDIDAFTVYSATANVSAPFSDYMSFQADVAPAAKDDGTPTGYTKIFAPNDSSLVYEIPQSFIVPESLGPDQVEYTTWVRANSAATGTGTTNVNVTLDFTQADYLSLPTGNLTAATASKSFVVFDITNDVNGLGYPINFSDSANATSRCIDNVVVSDTSISFTYHHGGSISSARTLVAVGRGVVSGHPPRTKSYYIGNTSTSFVTSNALFNGQIEYNTLNTTAGFAYSLKTADVITLKKVLYKSTDATFSNTDISTATDVTSYFTLDTGQRDNTYEYARAIVKRGASSVIAPTGRLLFIFDWFDHSGTGYVYIDSYLTSPNRAKGFTYEDVPSFTSPKTGRTINLRNVIDFRPVRSNYEFRNVGLQLVSSNTSVNTSYLTAAVSGEPYLIPASDRDWQGSYSYYLSRTDRITLTSDGQFRVVEGQPAVTPQAPSVDAASMLLYELQVPAYTLVDDTGKPTEVRIKSFDHKRYTMQDLVKVEDRVAHLEYYTALSQLEKAARDQSILDENNQERFKNGILVDSFAGTDVGDVAQDDWSASIDTVRQELRPAFRYAGDEDGEYSFDFSVDMKNTNTTDIVRIGDMAIPVYVEQSFITQPLATHSVSVNPFNIANFYGAMKLTPAVDTGKSVAPAQVIDMGGPTQAWLDANIPSYTNWGEWETTWTGTPRISTRQEWWVPEGWTEWSHPWRSQRVTTFEDVETTSRQQRLGTQFSYQSVPTTASLGNIIIDTSIVHSIRRRDLAFSGTGLKPNTELYAYFDGSAVQNYVQQANVLRLAAFPISSRFGVTPADATRPLNLKMGDTIYVKKPLTGTIAVPAGSTTITGTDTKFGYELVAGQLVQVLQGTDTYVRYINAVTSNTAASFSVAAPTGVAVATATLYTLTPVTIADVAERTYTIDGVEYIQYTLKVVRVQRDASIDLIVPYEVQAGSLSPTKLVNDSANTTSLASVVLGSIGGEDYSEFSVQAATIRSGVVRAYNSAAHTLRLDNDAPATSNNDIPIGTTIYFVGGTGAGQSSNVVSYNALTQTVTLDSTITLSDITAGETIYSIGALRTDGFLPVGISNSGGYNVSTLTSASVTTFAGSVAGALHLQENQFPVGSRVFLLMDNASNLVSDATTRAEATYTASGTLSVEQPTSITTRNVSRVARGVTDTRTITTTSNTAVDVDWVDPLAQSFLVDGKMYPLGVFITSVDLAFAEKPPIEDETPVSVEIRPMVNGYPSSVDVVPCVCTDGKAISTLRPIDVKVPSTGVPNFAQENTITRFKFPAPVHLIGGQEYAIVIRSNSDKFKVFTAQVSQVVLGTTGNIVGAQPYAGSFFKSQNASTWTAEQNEDLMFRLNRATWTAGRGGTLVMRATPFLTNTAFDSITFYPYTGSFGNASSVTYTLDILPMNQTTGDLTGQVAERYAVFADQPYTLPARSMTLGRSGRYGRIASTVNGNDAQVNNATYSSTGSANTIDAIVSLVTYSTDVAPFIDVEKASAVGVRHLINDMPLYASQFDIVTPGSGYANTAALTGTVTTSAGNTIITGSSTTFTSTLIVGRDVVIGGNLAVTVASIQNDTEFTAAAAPSESRAANVYSTYANLTLTITASDAGVNAVGYAVISAASASNTSGILTDVVLTTNGTGYLTSPTVTVTGNGAIVYRGEDWTTGGNGLTRYITKPVTLADGFEARDIKVYFDAYRPKGAKFYVYYRILPGTADTETLNTQNWRLMTQNTNDATISVRPNQYREFEFSTPESVAADATTDRTNQFKVFAVKIVMATDNTTAVPAIRNLRVIALDE